MATTYPTKIDNTITLPLVADNFTPIRAATVNILRNTIIAIESALGVNPAGTFGTVAARLDAFENFIVNGFPADTLTFYGDLRGNNLTQTVVGIQGNPVEQFTLGSHQDGYVLTWINSAGQLQFRPSSGGGGGGGSVIFSQDLSGDDFAQTVVGLLGVPLASTGLTQSVVPVYDTSAANFDVRQLTEDDILPGFSITSFSGGSTVECGATVVNPVFTATYSSAATSANITNTDSIDSPHTLSSPFTSATITGSFTHNGVNSSVVFTLHASNGNNKTATSTINYQARSFGGVGTAGATGATASGSAAVLVGATGTLANEGLHSSDVGQSYGSFSPSGQKIYLLLPHTASPHTFKDQNGFTFPMNAPTTFSFSNQNSASISMDLYESTNVLSTNFTITVST